ncbi:hypothetical protein GQ457_15G012380 [Hibiscus cannabinus]
MRAHAIFRVNTIVEVSTPLHRGRQGLVVHQSWGRRNCRSVHSTPSRETGLGCKFNLVMPDKIFILPPFLRVKDTEVCRRRSAPSCLKMSGFINTPLLHIKDVGLLIIIWSFPFEEASYNSAEEA